MNQFNGKKIKSVNAISSILITPSLEMALHMSKGNTELYFFKTTVLVINEA